jgi:hypothetical protein
MNTIAIGFARARWQFSPEPDYEDTVERLTEEVVEGGNDDLLREIFGPIKDDALEMVMDAYADERIGNFKQWLDRRIDEQVRKSLEDDPDEP